MPQLLGIPLAAINDDRLYPLLWILVLPHKQAIEERIAGAGQSLFGPIVSVSTIRSDEHTYFEGQMESNPKAVRGYISEITDRIAKQVTIGAVVDREGYPVGYEALAGNVRDHKNCRGDAGSDWERGFGLADRTLCMDRGMVTQDSLKLILGVHGPAMFWPIAGARPSDFRNKCSRDPGRPSAPDPDTGEAMVEVQEVGEEEGDRLILVRSRGCAQKEKGIHDRMLSKLKAHLELFGKRGAQGTASESRRRIDWRIGSILARHPGMSSWVCVRREELPAAAGETASGNQEAGRETALSGALACSARDSGTGAATGRCGTYCSTNVDGTDAGQVWRTM